MENIVIDEEHVTKTLESIERINSAVKQIKGALEEIGDFSAIELEPLLQPILSIEDANKHLAKATSLPLC